MARQHYAAVAHRGVPDSREKRSMSTGGWSRAGRIAAAAAVLWPSSARAGETWDGNGGDNNWSTNNNWSPNGEPAKDGTANLIFAGTNRLTPRVDVDWDINSLV